MTFMPWVILLGLYTHGVWSWHSSLIGPKNTPPHTILNDETPHRTWWCKYIHLVYYGNLKWIIYHTSYAYILFFIRVLNFISSISNFGFNWTTHFGPIWLSMNLIKWKPKHLQHFYISSELKRADSFTGRANVNAYNIDIRGSNHLSVYCNACSTSSFYRRIEIGFTFLDKLVIKL